MSENRNLMRRLARNESGSFAVDFGFLIGMLVLISVALIEFSLAVFDYTRAAEAARTAARIAVIEAPVGNLNNLSSDDVICTSVGGTPSCIGGAVLTPATFTTIYNAMHAVLPLIAPENIEVTYRFSGIGEFKSGGIKPNVTIRLTNLQRPFMFLNTLLGIGATITLPDFATTQIANGYETT